MVLHKSAQRTPSILNRIYLIRGVQIMLDRDLAKLYQVETRILNQAVKRNADRFPSDFMFQLTQEEFRIWKSQIVISNKEKMGVRKKPFAFTEQGVAMLSAILKSNIAITTSIQIIQAFVQMRKLITNNSLLLQRITQLEKQQLITSTKLEQVFQAINDKNIKPQKGIFFEGQVFDAYVFISKLIKLAQKSIILIDNYVDESILIMLSKRSENCTAVVYTKNISNKLKLDLEKHNQQYSPIEIRIFSNTHDRFLILDKTDVYHIGASLKDLGKKWFAFSRLNKNSILEIMRRLH